MVRNTLFIKSRRKIVPKIGSKIATRWYRMISGYAHYFPVMRRKTCNSLSGPCLFTSTRFGVGFVVVFTACLSFLPLARRAPTSAFNLLNARARGKRNKNAMNTTTKPTPTLVDLNNDNVTSHNLKITHYFLKIICMVLY